MSLDALGDIILMLGIIIGSTIFVKCNCDYLPREEKKDD